MKLIAFRCPQCPPVLHGALLFKAEGNAVIEIKCPRCKKIVVIEINNNYSFEEAMQMAKGND
jgi:phage FluMu protein Com